MKEFSLNIDLNDLNMTEEDKQKPSRDIVGLVISNIMSTYFSQLKGLPQPERKIFYSITSILEKASIDKIDTISFEDNEFGFIKKCLRETKLNPSALLRKVEEAIELVANR